MMPETLTELIPLKTDALGVIRVGGTRGPLETLIAAYREGATAEEIGEQYPSVALADIDASLAYYLRHRSEVDAYLVQGEAESARMQEESKRRHGNWPDLRQRLIARHER